VAALIPMVRRIVGARVGGHDRDKRNRHRVVDLRQPAAPDEQLLAGEDQSAVAQALARLSEGEREALLAHEVSG
jgi:DNA-directed RNA polymerase specialized sigma24 family protein